MFMASKPEFWVLFFIWRTVCVLSFCRLRIFTCEISDEKHLQQYFNFTQTYLNIPKKQLQTNNYSIEKQLKATCSRYKLWCYIKKGNILGGCAVGEKAATPVLLQTWMERVLTCSSVLVSGTWWVMGHCGRCVIRVQLLWCVFVALLEGFEADVIVFRQPSSSSTQWGVCGPGSIWRDGRWASTWRRAVLLLSTWWGTSSAGFWFLSPASPLLPPQITASDAECGSEKSHIKYVPLSRH